MIPAVDQHDVDRLVRHSLCRHESGEAAPTTTTRLRLIWRRAGDLAVHCLVRQGRRAGKTQWALIGPFGFTFLRAQTKGTQAIAANAM